jgi:hypothetical protein
LADGQQSTTAECLTIPLDQKITRPDDLSGVSEIIAPYFSQFAQMSPLRQKQKTATGRMTSASLRETGIATFVRIRPHHASSRPAS